MTRKIDILLFDGVNLLDVAGPVQAFEAANMDGRLPYQTRFVSADGNPVRACCGLQLTPHAKIAADGNGSDLLIPGGAGVDRLLENAQLLDLIRQYAAGPGRMISVCSGAMILAEAGVLDGIAATTHWARQEHTRDYPKVDWDLDRISISQGKVFTSAGVTTGIDLALAIIQVDCGPSTALAVARELIVQLRRTGAKASMPSTLPTSSPAMGQWRNSSSRLLPGQIWTGRWKRWPMPPA